MLLITRCFKQLLVAVVARYFLWNCNEQTSEELTPLLYPSTCHSSLYPSLWAPEEIYHPHPSFSHLSRGHSCKRFLPKPCAASWKQYATLSDTVTLLIFQTPAFSTDANLLLKKGMNLVLEFNRGLWIVDNISKVYLRGIKETQLPKGSCCVYCVTHSVTLWFCQLSGYAP